MTDQPLAETTRAALVTRGIETLHPLDNISNRPRVLTDLATVTVKLHPSYDDAWREMYWTWILGDGGVLVAPLLLREVLRILPYEVARTFNWSGVVTQYLAPDRATDERDASSAGRLMRRVHDLAFEYVEPDGKSWTPCNLLPQNFVLYKGTLLLVDLDIVEKHDDASARRRAARDFASGLPADAAERAYAQFLDAYDLA